MGVGGRKGIGGGNENECQEEGKRGQEGRQEGLRGTLGMGRKGRESEGVSREKEGRWMGQRE